jgi:hypothetical protein
MKQQHIHVLQAPMLVRTKDPDKPYYLLPAGTALYFHGSMPEGFDRYFIYVNTRAQLPTAPEEKPGLIDPIWVDPIDDQNLSGVLQKYPLTRNDLARILKAQKMKRADLEALLRDWKDD